MPDEAKPAWRKYGAWVISVLLAISLVGAVAPQFLMLYVCPDWDWKNNPVCTIGWFNVGPWMSGGSALSGLVLAFFVFVAPVLLLLLVLFSFLGGKK